MGKTKEFDPEEVLKGLTEQERDMLYRALWKPYVKADVKSRLKDREETLDDGQVDWIVSRWVEDGRYDCNISYWVNMDVLIDEALKDAG